MEIVPSHNNAFYQDLAKVMANPDFRRFLSCYMSSWTDVETSIMYIKLYETLQQYVEDDRAVMVGSIKR